LSAAWATAASLIRGRSEIVLHPLAAARAHVAQAQDVLVHRLHVVERHRLAGVLEQVEDVVHGVDQAVDLLPVDRRDEGLVQQAMHLGRDPVGLALGGADLAGVLVAQVGVGVVLDQADEGARAFGDEAAVLVEQLEEISLARQELAEKHSVSPCWPGSLRAGAPITIAHSP
jgi:hypothetical protein